MHCMSHSIHTPHTLHYTIDGIEHTLKTSNRLNETMYESRGSPMYKISPEQNKLCADLKHILCWWKAFADEHAIPWWMTAGSLLGTVRHQGLIPWDNDIDICILSDDFNMEYQDKMTSLIGLCPTTYGTYEIQRSMCGFRVYPVGKSFPFMDIWQYGKESVDSTRYTYSGTMDMISIPHIHTHYAASSYPHFFHILDELDVREDHTVYGTFEGIQVPIPNNPVQCIARWYGERAMTELYYDDHVDSHAMVDVRNIEKTARFFGSINTLTGMNPSITTDNPIQMRGIMDKHGLKYTDADLSKLVGSTVERVLCTDRPKTPKQVVGLMGDLVEGGEIYVRANIALLEADILKRMLPK